MNSAKVVLGLVSVAALAAGAFLGWQERAAAAGAKPALDATFGPIQVEGSSRATFFLALRNTGGGDANLAAGDRIEVHYGTGGGAGDLLATGEAMVVDPLPAGLVLQRLTDGGGAEIGIRFAADGQVTIAPGAAQVFLFRGATAPPGGAPVSVDFKLAKTAGRPPKRIALTVVKTPPSSLTDFYGDGSDGPLVLDANAEVQSLRNHTDVLIKTGVTVTVSSGTTIRCTGSFENRGTIVVLPGSPGGGTPFETVNLGAQLVQPASSMERGDALAAARVPAVLETQAVGGAPGGRGLGSAVFSLPLSHYRHGGGGGSGSLGAIGGDGGGLLRVIARGAIRNGGTIVARGGVAVFNRSGLGGGSGAGGGGGGGGIVLLASGASVDNSAPENANGAAAGGVIDVSGGNGGTADPFGGGGGGGGGGLVVFCAPSVPTNGTMNLFGGLSAFQAFHTNETVWAGGGGGGACVGDGGDGSPVRAGGEVGPAPGNDPTAATPGQLVVRLADPRTLWQ